MLFILVIITVMCILLILLFDGKKPRKETWKTESIPLKIWQTYKTKNFTQQIVNCQKTWTNQGIEYCFMEDTQIEQFIKENFDVKTYETFKKLPLGVMKADLWRYCILYKYGGIYSDIDTECLKPIRDWGLEKKNKIILGMENNIHFCQWTIVSSPKHPILKNVIKMINKEVSKGIDTTDEHFVHKYTGPGIWTKSIMKTLGLSGDETSLSVQSMYKNIKYKKLFDYYGIVVKSDTFFNGDVVKHYFASQNFDEHYESWLDEKDDL